MKTNTMRLSAAIVGVLVTTVLVAGATNAFGGWGKGGNNIKTAIEEGDYGALGENPKMTEDQFNQMIEAHNLMQEGKYEEAKELKKGMDFGGWKAGMKRGAGMSGIHSMKFNAENREAINAAIAAGDYNAWLEAVGEDCPLADKINEENFSRFAEAHNLMGQARTIFAELGINHGMGWHK